MVDLSAVCDIDRVISPPSAVTVTAGKTVDADMVTHVRRRHCVDETTALIGEEKISALKPLTFGAFGVYFGFFCGSRLSTLRLVDETFLYRRTQNSK